MEGNHEDFALLFQTRFRSIARFIRTKVDNPTLAEDIALEAFAIAWEKYQKGTPITVSWLLTTARNLIGNEYQRRDRERALLHRVAMEALTNEWGRDDDVEHAELRFAISRLRLEDALAIRLTYWDGFTATEVAQFLDCTTAAVWMRLTRARATLRRLLDAHEHAGRAERFGGGVFHGQPE